jgi:hypothetical protein
MGRQGRDGQPPFTRLGSLRLRRTRAGITAVSTATLAWLVADRLRLELGKHAER